jgi:hypothetical protein
LYHDSMRGIMVSWYRGIMMPGNVEMPVRSLSSRIEAFEDLCEEALLTVFVKIFNKVVNSNSGNFILTRAYPLPFIGVFNIR